MRRKTMMLAGAALAGEYRRYREVLPADGRPDNLAGDKRVGVDSRASLPAARARRPILRPARIIFHPLSAAMSPASEWE
jgi:hypothetical protein